MARPVPEPLDASTHLAVLRTRLALERTMMGWIRTSTSLIAFGFTIFKFFEYRAGENHRTVVTPWVVGVVMISIGLISLGLAVLQHFRETAQLRSQDPDLPPTLTGPIAALIAFLGILALVMVAFRM